MYLSTKAGVRTNELSLCLYCLMCDAACDLWHYYCLLELYEVEFHKPRYIEEDKDGLPRGACFVARRFELASVVAFLRFGSGLGAVYVRFSRIRILRFL